VVSVEPHACRDEVGAVLEFTGKFFVSIPRLAAGAANISGPCGAPSVVVLRHSDPSDASGVVTVENVYIFRALAWVV
jgi:hypothetical protein